VVTGALRAMLVVPSLLVGPPMTDGSKVMTRLKVIPWSSRLAFGRESDNSLRKNIDVEKFSGMLQKGLPTRRRSGYEVKFRLLVFGATEHRSKLEH